ncbi:MAG TPA: CHAT domain-containing protein [Kofleriaceae bacterium]|nr:CHAT domain-containing protein [Kofleriaceae bacterium]
MNRLSGERLDYAIERQRHEGFIGRAAVLAELDRLLVEDKTDHWVVVTGGPGMGKSAILAAWLARREEAGAIVPHHFIRRGFYGWDEPAKIVRSLAAQIEACYPAQRDLDAPPESRLVDLLSRVSAQELVPRGKRLVLLVDGLDEYDAPAGTYDPLAAFLPHALPRGVRLLCASRPRHPHLDALAARDGELTRLDLDDPFAIDDNAATVRAFWRREAPVLGLGDQFVEEAVARADGNLQHAATLRKHLASVPPAQRRVEVIPRGLQSLLTMLWGRLASNAVAVRGLGILCAAREPLSLDELAVVAGWDDVAQRQTFVRAARELLLETRRADGLAEYRLHHDAIRAHIIDQFGVATTRHHHGALAQRLATWPAPSDAARRRYALRHALAHRTEAGDWPAVSQLAGDLGFLEAKCRALGVHDVESDVGDAAERCRGHGDDAIGRDLSDLSRALGRESHWLRDEPNALAAQLWNRLRRMGWSTDDLERRLRTPKEVAAFVRVRHAVSRESPSLLRDLVGHWAMVTACVVAPDGKRVVSTSLDRTVKVWDLDTGRVLITLEGHTALVNSCAVTPDGRRVISASLDRTVKVWDLDTGRVLTLEGHTDGVSSCAVTPDGRRVVSASYDRTVKVWDIDTGRLLTTLDGHTYPVMSCVVTLDGRRVISASDNTLKVWNLDTGGILTTLKGHSGGVNSCAVTPDGQSVVSASDDKTVKIWDLDTGRVLTTFEGHTDSVMSCAVTPDGRRVISASDDNTLKVWNLDTGGVLTTLEGHIGAVRSCVVIPDGRRVVSASYDGTLKVWDLDTGRTATMLEGHTGWVSSCVVTPDGRRVVSASYDGTLKVWDLNIGRVVTTLEGHTAWVMSCVVTPDGRCVISASYDGTLKVWDLNTGRVVTTLEGHTDSVTSCAVTSDGRRVVSASDDKTLKVWDLDTGRVVTTLKGHAGWVMSCTVTPDGRRVVSASNDQTVKVWDLDTGRVVITLEGHAGWATSCTVTPDGRRVVATSYDHTVKVWDLDTGRVVTTLEGHTGSVRSCVVTPDGRCVVSASDDKTLKVWDLATYQCLVTHRGDTGFTAVAATTGTICAGDAAGTLWFLDWPWLSLSPSPDPGLPPALSTSNAPTTTMRGSSLRKARQVILFLSANPSDTSRLALDEECAAIKRELRMTAHRDDFEFRSAWAVTVDEMARHLIEWQPTIVHFSGHGVGSAPALTRTSATYRDVAVPAAGSVKSGIYLQGEQGGSQLVTARALAMMIKSAAASARVVVLNACYSELQADALCSGVDCVVGMTGAIRDDAARSFAVGFYRALGDRRSVANAVEHAVATLAAKQHLDEHLPRCRTREGVDAHQVVLGGLTASM